LKIILFLKKPFSNSLSFFNEGDTNDKIQNTRIMAGAEMACESVPNLPDAGRNPLCRTGVFRICEVEIPLKQSENA
jgi:hypothetical protein